MQNKHEWRKKEKTLYLPKQQPEIINVPAMNFISIRGTGSPDTPLFTDKVGALYSVAYTIKMTLKSMTEEIHNYQDFTVYPLEGVWDINDEAKANFNGIVNKKDFVFELMIRQPDIVSPTLFENMLSIAKQKKPDLLLDQIEFGSTAEGLCVQMLHVGPYENEPMSFDKMERFCTENSLNRLSKVHREIYLSDVRKVTPEKLKTVLRFKVQAR